MNQITGSCLCGSLNYTCNSDSLFTAVCHCKACQKSTGSAFSVVMGVKKDDLTITGDTLRTYESVGESEKETYRHFCSKCGSTIMAEMASRPGLACIKAGTLDRPSELSPQLHVYWRDHQKWIENLGELTKHETTLR